MIPRVLRNISTKLCNFDFSLEVFLECRKQNLSQRDFQTIHQIRDWTVAIIFRKVYHLVVNEFLICHTRLKRVQVSVTRICRQPCFAIICTFLIEHHVNRIVTRFAAMCKIHDFLMFKILLEFLACTCSQTFIIFCSPPWWLCVCRCRYTHRSPSRWFGRLFPCTILAFVIEYFFLCSLFRLQNGRIHKTNKSRNLCKWSPFILKQVDSQPFNMRTIQILVRHE